MKLTLASLILAVSVLGCSRKDAIDRLTTKVERESVPSYLFMPIKLPETATPQQCISVLTNRGDLHVQKILEIRPTHTPIWNYTAVMLDSDAGRKIVLLHYMDTNGWYFKIYDAR